MEPNGASIVHFEQERGHHFTQDYKRHVVDHFVKYRPPYMARVASSKPLAAAPRKTVSVTKLKNAARKDGARDMADLFFCRYLWGGTTTNSQREGIFLEGIHHAVWDAEV